jgi:hypothetical protein
MGETAMTDFDFGSVYGGARSNPAQGIFAAIRRIAGFEAATRAPALRTVEAAPAKGRNDRAYLADIGMEVGF